MASPYSRAGYGGAGPGTAAEGSADVAALREQLLYKERELEVTKLRQQLAEKEAMLSFLPQSDPLNLAAVPQLVSQLRGTSGEHRLSALEQLSDMVGAAFDDDGAAIGAAVRETGGIAELAWLLTDGSTAVQNEALVVLGNLCSNAVDPHSDTTKRDLLACGAANALVQCLRTRCCCCS